MPKKLETMDAETLMTTPMQPLKFIVQGLIPQGLHVLAGSPKIGKSWLALWICLQVSKGEKVWDFETTQSEVLYLCLEDSFARIQSRLFEITDEAPPTLHFAIMSNAIGSGLEKQIENFISEHPDTGLIVIDTLQKIRKTVSANVNPYAADYDDINALKQIADKYKIAIVLVHHLRKTGDSDPLNMISGTSGIAGGADTNFILQKDKRTENTASLICTGRDIEGRELFLEFNRCTFVWELVSPIIIDALIIPDEIILLCDFVKSVGGFTGTATELAEVLKLELRPAVLKKKIIKHMEHLNKNGIRYSENRTFDRREFSLCYDGNDDMTVNLSPLNLPSLPSASSAESNLASIAPCPPLCAEIDDGVA
ncbi:MAG TPA: AAA family ATPase [Oscillospiraceae bacterium]|nr:AAA family ATPase [Oscillospiraceae bacterium]HPF55148.1 AAA family ATPase [Clostridiales bacterium]HPK34477.1 AAA family ATPase [Oscillospiraceae bacterium]HPR76303.1 AAA family ATPase [Oscillospiraceae bacterium]